MLEEKERGEVCIPEIVALQEKGKRDLPTPTNQHLLETSVCKGNRLSSVFLCWSLHWLWEALTWVVKDFPLDDIIQHYLIWPLLDQCSFYIKLLCNLHGHHIQVVPQTPSTLMKNFRQAIFFTDKLCMKNMTNKIPSGLQLLSRSGNPNPNHLQSVGMVRVCAPVEGEKPVKGYFMATACHQA